MKRFSQIESIERNSDSLFIGMTKMKSKLLGDPLTPLRKPVPPSESTGLTPITKPFPSTSLGPITNVGQLGQSRNPLMFLYHLNLTLTDFGHLSKTLTTPKLKLVFPFLPLMKQSWKPNGNHVPFFYFFSVRGNVTESTIIATIYCPDVGYCLFEMFPSIACYLLSFLYLPRCYSFLLGSTFFARIFIPLAPCTRLGYSTLPTMYYWISTSVAIPCLFDSITCFVSCILSPLYPCFRT